MDILFNDPNIIGNTSHIDLNDRIITNARIVQVNQLPQIDSHLTAKLYVDNAIEESTFVKINQDNDFNNNDSTNRNKFTLSIQAVNDNQDITKSYVSQFHNDNERNRHDLGFNFYDESNDLVKNNRNNDLNDNKLTNVNSITNIQNPTPNNEV